MNNKTVKIFISFLIIVIGRAYGEDHPGGATIVPVLDGLPASPFNLKTDAASIYLEKAILYKDNGWFTNDKEVAITAKMSINSRKKRSFGTNVDSESCL